MSNGWRDRDAARGVMYDAHDVEGPGPAWVGTLEGAITAAANVPGVSLNELACGAQVRVQTQNSTYQVLICDPFRRRAVILGGRFFQVPTSASVSGSTFGGSLLKHGWIGLGMRLEVQCCGTTIMTSPVQDIGITSTSWSDRRSPHGWPSLN